MDAKKKSYLTHLIGQTIQNVEAGINSVISLKKKNEEKSDEVTSVYTQILFNEYRLDIYNKAEIIGPNKNKINELVGRKVIDAHETNENAELIFDNNYRLIIDLREDAFGSDPEAMCLLGPNDLIVVWD